jgi:hypothetical protein
MKVMLLLSRKILSIDTRRYLVGSTDSRALKE